VAYTQ